MLYYEATVSLVPLELRWLPEYIHVQREYRSGVLFMATKNGVEEK